MLKQIKTAVFMLLVFTVLTGLVYPLLVTGLAQLIFPHQANGSLIAAAGQVTGSELIGQAFSEPRYFWGRLSATSGGPYNAATSGGTNLGPTNPDLVKQVQERIGALQAADPGNTQPIPVDLVTASGSGLDPDISLAAAQYQVGRIARLRGLAVDKVQNLVDQHTQGRMFGILGEPRVNVLELNLALDGLK